MTFSICPRCRKTDSSYRFATCDCTDRDDDTQEAADYGFHGS